MKTIYLDHNIVHYFVRGFPAFVDRDAEYAALNKLLGAESDARFVVSDWHLVEASRESGREGNPDQMANAYAEFFQRLNPVFIPPPVHIERMEVAHYVFSDLMRIEASPAVVVFNTYFSQLVAIAGVGPVEIGYTLRDFLQHLVHNVDSQQALRSSEQQVPHAMKALQKARLEGNDKDPLLQRQIYREWFGSLLPSRLPDGTPITRDDREGMLEAIGADPQAVLHRCPAVFAEDSLTAIRADFVYRHPKRQDAIDLMHAVSAVAYCDSFITNDRHLLVCSKRTTAVTGRDLQIAMKLSDVA